MEFVEQFVAGKLGDPDLCEDAVVVTDHFAAVIDGATDITGRRYDGLAGGRWAMQRCRAALLDLAATVDAAGAVRALTLSMADIDLPPEERPSASVTVYSAARCEIWQVGDVGFRAGGVLGQPRKRVDRVASEFRAAYLSAEAAAGRLTGMDAGRPLIRELIARQGVFRNTPGPYGFAAVDGRPIPMDLVVVEPVPAGDVVIASDGYPVIGRTLRESEAELSRLLARDPWCVAELIGTKGVSPGQASFDDRAYLRVHT